MIRSMTGFGRAREVLHGRDISVEIKSVNHRFLETFVRVPRTYSFLEEPIRSAVQQRIARGKVEISVSLDDSQADTGVIRFNRNLFEQYYGALNEVASSYGLPFSPDATLALRLPDVLSASSEETDTDAVWQDVRTVLEAALDAFVAQRECEGARLASDIVGKCGEILSHVDFIESRSGMLVEEYIAKLRKRIEALLGDTKVDEQRLLTETAIMADRLAVDEEIVRLHAHCDALAEMFRSGTSNGKKMDFIIQEMNREINTISSKIGDLDVTRRVIEVKTCIEKIREQVQNIE